MMTPLDKWLDAHPFWAVAIGATGILMVGVAIGWGQIGWVLATAYAAYAIIKGWDK
jgi:hypothetical protein